MAGSSDSEGEGGVESRSKVLKRHKKEVIAAQKAQKALGKKRADEGAALVAAVNARHVAELAALEARPPPAEAAEAAAAATEAPAVEAGVAEATAALAASALSEPAAAAADAGGKARSRWRARSAARLSCA